MEIIQHKFYYLNPRSNIVISNFLQTPFVSNSEWPEVQRM